MEERFTDAYRKHRKNIITQEFEMGFNLFKEYLLNNILKSLPCGSIELNRIMANTYSVCDLKFIQECERNRINAKSIEKYLMLFKLKCKAQEGYIRYYNDMESLKLSHDIKKNLIKSYLNEGATIEDLLLEYHRSIKGTYCLQGIEELKELFNIEFREIKNMLDSQYEENLTKLKSLYSGVISSKIIDIDIFSRTLGFENAYLNENGYSE